MKRIFYILIFAALLSSCQKADDNGDLGGFWKLLKIEEFAADTVIITKDIDRFWSIQLDLLVTTGDAKGRFQHVGDSLYVQMLTRPYGKIKSLREVGIYNPDDERFEVLYLGRSKMMLRSDSAFLEFRKF